MQAMESQFDVCTEDLFNQTIKLEEMEKKAGNAESDVSALRSRLILLQENNEKQEERLAKCTLELAGACVRADGSVKKSTTWRTACPATRNRSTGWRSSSRTPSSCTGSQSENMRTFPAKWPHSMLMQPGETRG